MAQYKRILSINKSSPSMGRDTQSWRYSDIQKEPGLPFKKEVEGVLTF